MSTLPVSRSTSTSAVLLAGDDHRIDDRAAVVDRDVADQLDATRVEIDLDLGRAGCLVPVDRADALPRLGVQPALRLEPTVPEQVPAARAPHDLPELDASVGRPAHADAALGNLEVVAGRLQQLGASVEQLVANLVGGLGDGRARGVGRATRAGLLLVGRDVGVHLGDVDSLGRDAQSLGGQQRQDGLQTLAHLDGAGEHVDAAILVQLDAGGGGRGGDGALDDAAQALATDLRADTARRLVGGPADRRRCPLQQFAEVAIGDRLARGEGVAVGEQVLHSELVRVHA
jgi:hypothetical protein